LIDDSPYLADLPAEVPPTQDRAPLVDDRRRVKTLNSSVDAVMPANIDAEKVILAAILLDNAAYSEAAEKLDSDDFSLDSHRRIFLRMSDLVEAQKAVDIVTLAHELARHKEIESVGGVAFLASITEGVPRRPAVTDYIALVKDKSALRKIMSICSAAINRAADQSESAMTVLEAAEGQLMEIAQDANTGKPRTVAESVESAGGVDIYMAPIINPVEKTGLMTGFLDYDNATGGLQKSELTVIAARTSMGKTGLLANMLQNICIGTENVALLFSLEMSRVAIERRLLASIARVDVKRAMSGWHLSSLEKEKLYKALSVLVESHIIIDDSSTLTPVQMRAKARRVKQKYGRLDLLAVDYAQLLDPGRKVSNEQEGVSIISKSLKACAKELETSVVALAQLNRNNEARQDKRPMLSDLRSSGQLEQDADVVTAIHREAYYRPDDEDVKGLAELLIMKQRNGATGVIKLAFDGSLTRFDNLARS
jgi:replicative DNA helicase